MRYKTIEPGRTHKQQSFITHPWTACTTSEPKRRLAVNGSAAIFPHETTVPAGAPGESQEEENESDAPPAVVMDVAVAPPALLSWSPWTHARFPRVFRTAVETFVMCHARLEDEPGTLGMLPLAMRDLIIELLSPPVPDWLPIQAPRPDTPPPAG